MAVGSIIVLAVVLLSPLASADPDGLERVATDFGFINAGQSAPYSIIPDYTLPFLGETAVSTIMAGVIDPRVLIMGDTMFLPANIADQIRSPFHGLYLTD